MTSAVMDGLVWRKATTEQIQTTKSGMPIYNGSAIGFREWRFRVMGKFDAVSRRDDAEAQKCEVAAKVLDGLTDDAMAVAMDLGRSKLVAPDGLPTLVTAIESAISGKRIAEAKGFFP